MSLMGSSKPGAWSDMVHVDAIEHLGVPIWSPKGGRGRVFDDLRFLMSCFTILGKRCPCWQRPKAEHADSVSLLTLQNCDRGPRAVQ